MKKINNFINLISITGVTKTYLVFLVFLMIFSGVLDLLSLGLIAPYISAIFDINQTQKYIFFFNLANYEKNELILYFTIFLIFIFFIKTFLSIFTRWLIALFAHKYFAILQVKLMDAYQNMNYQDYILRSSSEYIRNVRELCSECLDNIDHTLRVLSEFIIFLVIIIFLAITNYQIVFLVLITTLPIFLIYEKLLKPINAKLGIIKNESTKQMYKNIDTGIKGLKEIKVLTKQNFFLKRLSYFAEKIYKTQKKSILISDSPRYVYEFFLVSLALITILIVYKSAVDPSIFLPTLGVFIFAGLRLLPTIASITSSLSRIEYGQNAVKIVYEDLKKYSTSFKLRQNKTNNKIETFENLVIKDVNFTYKNSNLKVFNKVNFNLKKNECIGIVGESGVGKTTFVDLILGLLKPDQGQILLNNKNISDTSNFNMNNVAYLPQDPIILDEKINLNISLEEDKNLINSNNLKNSMIKANFDKIAYDLPNKIETSIGENGVRLSGGQNKRLALARAFYFGKQIIIMDEATSSLDIESENYIAEQLKQLKSKLTIIIISHHKNILKHCDKIYKIENKKLNLLKEEKLIQESLK